MNNQLNPWSEVARQCGIPQTAADFQRAALGLANSANLYQGAGMPIYGLQNALANKAEPKLDRARRIAAEVRARKPEMQVRRLTKEADGPPK